MGCREYPRETLEFIPILLALDGVPITDFSSVLVTIKHSYERPDDGWEAPIEVDDEWGFMLDGTELGVGTYAVWAQITDNPEVPVLNLGTLKVT